MRVLSHLREGRVEGVKESEGRDSLSASPTPFTASLSCPISPHPRLLLPFFDASPVTTCLTRGQRQRRTEAPLLQEEEEELGVKTLAIQLTYRLKGQANATDRRRRRVMMDGEHESA